MRCETLKEGEKNKPRDRSTSSRRSDSKGKGKGGGKGGKKQPFCCVHWRKAGFKGEKDKDGKEKCSYEIETGKTCKIPHLSEAEYNAEFKKLNP